MKQTKFKYVLVPLKNTAQFVWHFFEIQEFETNVSNCHIGEEKFTKMENTSKLIMNQTKFCAF